MNALYKIRRQEKNVVASWFHHQRDFFIKQVFDKDLNPYQAFTRSKSMADLRSHGRKPNSKENEQTKSKDGTLQVPQIQLEGEDVTSEQINGYDSNARHGQGKPKVRLGNDTEPSRLPKVNTGQSSDVTFVTHLPKPSEYLPPISNGTLKNNDAPSCRVVKSTDNVPSHLPIIREASAQYSSKPRLSPSLKPLNSPSLPNLSKSLITPGGATGKSKRKQTTQKARNSVELALINKLSQTLPANLFRKAEEKIRVITKTEEIYKNKQRLLEQHKSLIHNNALDDPRWKLLHSSLSENKESVDDDVTTMADTLRERKNFQTMSKPNINNYF